MVPDAAWDIFLEQPRRSAKYPYEQKIPGIAAPARAVTSNGLPGILGRQPRDTRRRIWHWSAKIKERGNSENISNLRTSFPILDLQKAILKKMRQRKSVVQWLPSKTFTKNLTKSKLKEEKKLVAARNSKDYLNSFVPAPRWWLYHRHGCPGYEQCQAILSQVSDNPKCIQWLIIRNNIF